MKNFQKWTGGPAPVSPGTWVDVDLRGFGHSLMRPAGELQWEHDKTGNFTSVDIVGWRLAEEPAAPRFVVEQEWIPQAFDREDSGAALIYQISDGEDEGMFVRLQSWDETKRHEQFNQFRGKKLRVTVEVID